MEQGSPTWWQIPVDAGGGHISRIPTYLFARSLSSSGLAGGLLLSKERESCEELSWWVDGKCVVSGISSCYLGTSHDEKSLLSMNFYGFVALLQVVLSERRCCCLFRTTTRNVSTTKALDAT